LRALLVLVVCSAAACSILSGALLAFFRSDAPSNRPERTLTFAERVAYQRAIENVYWRHRIWPRNRGERPDPKPSLDTVMSQAQLEKKVADYLSKSKALEDYWHQPLTAAQLQAEMDRMAQRTKQPEVLRELFEALGDNSFVIAECLARPVLAERSLAYSGTEQVKQTSVTYDHVIAGTGNYSLPTISDWAGCTDDTRRAGDHCGYQPLADGLGARKPPATCLTSLLLLRSGGCPLDHPRLLQVWSNRLAGATDGPSPSAGLCRLVHHYDSQ